MTGTRLNNPDAARRRFVIAQAVLAVLFVVTMLVIGRLRPGSDSAALRWLFAGGPIALLLLWAREFVRMIRADDEMMQAAHLRAVAISAGLVLMAAALWDVLVRLVGVPPVPAFLLLPAFALLYSIAVSRILSPK